MRRFILGWKNLCAARQWRAFSVNHADDFVIRRAGRADAAMGAMRRMMERLKPTVNEDKTQLCQLPRERFDFLGYAMGRCCSRKTGKAYLGTRPAKKSVQRMVESVRHTTESKMEGLKAEPIVQRLNQKLAGWAKYFGLGQVSPAYQAIDRYTTQRLRLGLGKKPKVQGSGRSKYPDQYLREKLGLIQLSVRARNLPLA